MSDYYDYELTSLEDNPGNLSGEYIKSMLGEMSDEDYRKHLEDLEQRVDALEDEERTEDE